MADSRNDRSNYESASPLNDAPAQPGSSNLQRLLHETFQRNQLKIRSTLDNQARLAAVVSVQDEINSRRLDLDSLLNLITERAVTILGATGAAIALEGEGVVVCRASSGATGPDLGVHLSAQTGLSGECFRTGTSILCSDVETDLRVDTAAARTLGIRSVVLVPIHHHGSVVGVFEAFSSWPDFFQNEDAELMELVSGFITTAITYSGDLNVLQVLESERNTMLHAIEQITPAISKLLEAERSSAEATQQDELSNVQRNASNEGLQEWAETLGQRFTPMGGSSLGNVGEPPLSDDFTDEFKDEEQIESDTSEPEYGSFSDPTGVTTAVDKTAGDAALAGQPVADGSLPYLLSTPQSTRFTRENIREERALQSAVDSLLAQKDNMLLPLAESSSPADQVETGFCSGSAAISSTADITPAASSRETPRDETAWAPPISEPPTWAAAATTQRPTATRKDHVAERVLAAVTSPTSLSTPLTSVRPPRSPQGGRSLISGRGASVLGSRGGGQRASKTVGSSKATLAQIIGDLQAALRWRNVLEYAVPALLTGLLIVIALQFVSTHKTAESLLRDSGGDTPAPMMDPGRLPNPVELSPLVNATTTRGSDSGSKLVAEVTAALAPHARQTADDWSADLGKAAEVISKLPTGTAEFPSASPRSGSGVDLGRIEIPKYSHDATTVSPPNQSVGETQRATAVRTVQVPAEALNNYVVRHPAPQYPEAARKRGITGVVVLNLVIGPDGKVKTVHALSGSNKYLAEAAKSAMLEWRYQPFVMNGQPVQVATQVRVAFRRQPGAR